MANRVKVIKDVAFYSRLNRKYVLCCCYITTTLYKKGSEGHFLPEGIDRFRLGF